MEEGRECSKKKIRQSPRICRESSIRQQPLPFSRAHSAAADLNSSTHRQQQATDAKSIFSIHLSFNIDTN